MLIAVENRAHEPETPSRKARHAIKNALMVIGGSAELLWELSAETSKVNELAKCILRELGYPPTEERMNTIAQQAQNLLEGTAAPVVRKRAEMILRSAQNAGRLLREVEGPWESESWDAVFQSASATNLASS